MKTKKVSYPPFNIATSFMLVIFIILCMVIFAVLSLSNAVKDYNYSEKNAARTTAYYEANNQAEEMLAKIDGILGEQRSVDETIAKLETIDGLTLSLDETSTTLLIEYNIPINDSETLTVNIEADSGSLGSFKITSWQQHSTTEWTGDQSLPILGSE